MEFIKDFSKRFVPQEAVKGVCGNATIFLAKHKIDAEITNVVCVKRIEVMGSKKWTLEECKKEITVHKLLSSDADQQAVVPFLGGFYTKKYVWVAMEYYENGSLYQFLEKNYLDGITNDLVGLADILSSMLYCLIFLHDKGIAHRDVKPDNFLITNDYSLRLCDFGYSGEMNTDADKPKCGTLNYMSPELVASFNDINDEMCDVWAFGICAYELYCGVTPWTYHETSRKVIQSIIFLTSHKDCFDESSLGKSISLCIPMLDLLKSCLQIDASKRTTLREILIKNPSPLPSVTKHPTAIKNPPINLIRSAFTSKINIS